MKLRSAKTSILHQNSCLMNRLEVGRASPPESAKGKYESNTSSAFKKQRRSSTPSGLALIKLLKSRPTSPCLQKFGTAQLEATRNSNFSKTNPRKSVDLRTDWAALRTQTLTIINEATQPGSKIF